MNIPKGLLMTVAALAVACAGPVAAQDKGKDGKKLYCWNEGGRRVCGDALPADAVDSERTEFNARSGMKTGQLGRALTGAERTAAAAQAEAERVAALSTAAAARREQAMVESYASEDDLRRAFGERIAMLDGTVKASQMGVTGLRQSLVSLLRRAGEQELANKPVHKVLADNIRTQHGELLRQQSLLSRQQADRVEIDAELASAVERYRALKRPAANGG